MHMKRKSFLKHIGFIVVVVTASLALCGHIIASQKEQFRRSLEAEITAIAREHSGEFSCVVKALKFPYSRWQVEENKPFAAASLIKVPMLAVVFGAIEAGDLSLDDPITVRRRDITGGSGIIKAMKVPVTFTLDELLEIMIASSDNTATNKVIGLLGYEYYNRKFKELGLMSTSLVRKMMDFSRRDKGVENYTCARDVAYLLEKMYKGELVNEAASRMMIGYLKKQKVNDRLPRYLPESTTVAHKTGLERGIVHDAGIVFTEKGDYIICVLTRGVGSYRDAKKFIADTSLTTYNLYQ